MRKLALAISPWLLAALAALPIWIVRWAPIEDLPLHLATLRILSDFSNPQFGFDADYVLALGRTQYIGYYVLGSLLAHVVGVWAAHRILVSLFLGGTVLAMRALLRALGKDERGCLFVVPLLYGPLFVIGLFPFLLALPLLLLSLALCHTHLEKPSWRRGGAAAACLLVLFFWHVVPFGVAAMGAVVLSGPAHARRLWPLAPSALACAGWLALTDAGRQLTDTFRAPSHRLAPLDAVRDLYTWLGDSYFDRSDEVCFSVFFALAIAAGVVAILHGSSVRRWGWLPLACIVLYVMVGRDHGFMWPIAQRFPLVAALLAIPLLSFPSGRWGTAMAAALASIGVAAIGIACVQFVRFQAEVGPFDRALDSIPPRKHVAALVFDRESNVVRYSPFLHFGSYYQVEKGGVVLFSFAGYNHWPIDFRPGHYPPPGGPARPRWEWTPETVDPDTELFPYFDDILVRGKGLPETKCYEPKFTEGAWSVYERTASCR